MASLTAIRKGLATQLATISGLRTFHTDPDKVELPAAVVGPPDDVLYDETYKDTVCWHLPVRLIVSRWDAARAQDQLDPYVSNTGASSVKLAIEADRTLGGVADSTRVVSMRGYGRVSWNGVDYLGCDFHVEVISD